MSLFKRLRSKDSKSEDDKEKKTIAIVGLDGAGKTTIVNRILRSEFNLSRPTFGINIEIYKYRTLEFVVYDLGGQTPLRESLWEKFVSSADGLVFVLDSADQKRFALAAKEMSKFKRTKYMVAHANAKDKAKWVVSQLALIFKIKEDIQVVEAAPVLGVHAGPGTVGFGFIGYND